MKGNRKSRVRSLFHRLLSAHGVQGWWPVRYSEQGRRAYGQDFRGYRPGSFVHPVSSRGRWEVCCGALLTQNTAWGNVERALEGLQRRHLLFPRLVLGAPEADLAETIRPAGYFNQKTRHLKALAQWFLSQDSHLSRMPKDRDHLMAVRAPLLEVRGIGPETADSILLYAYGFPVFVVDAYTRRIFHREGLAAEQASYQDLQELVESCWLCEGTGTVEVFREFHALLVAEGKLLSLAKRKQR